MGADLYIEPTHKRNHKALEPRWYDAIFARDMTAKTHGEDSPEYRAKKAAADELYAQMYSPKLYYRDCYNCFSTLRAFGISWWQDVVLYQDKKGRISKTKARELAERIKNAAMVLEWSADDFKHAIFDKEKVTAEIFETQLKPYWLEDRDQLVRFLLSYANDKRRGIYLLASL